MRRFTPITLEEVKEVLKEKKGWTTSVCGSEVVFDFTIKSTGNVIRVYSSVNTAGVCRPCGQDAIRVCVIRKMKGVRVYRTPNWRDNLQKQVMKAFRKFS